MQASSLLTAALALAVTAAPAGDSGPPLQAVGLCRGGELLAIRIEAPVAGRWVLPLDELMANLQEMQDRCSEMPSLPRT